MTYLYSEEQPTMAAVLPPAADRRVTDPDRIVFRPGWSVPLESFSFRGMTVQKRQEPIDGANVRYLEVRVEGEDTFGLHSIGFRVELPEAGRYVVSLEALGGPDQARTQIYLNEEAEGDEVDLYRPSREATGVLRLAELNFSEGDNVVLLKLTGRDERSSGLGLAGC